MAETLPEALEDLFGISDLPIEIIVIDDGSTDSTREVIGRYRGESEKSENIIFKSIHIENCGRAEAINRGAEQAQGTYLSFVDADDLVDTGELMKLWHCARESRHHFILGSFRIITESGKVAATRLLDPGISKKQLIRKIAFSPIAPIHLNATLINREHFLKTGGFDKALIRSQDKDLTLRVLGSVDQFTICDSCHYLYRKHPLGKKETILKRLEWIRYRQRMIRKNFNGFTMIASMSAQFCFDMGKLLYEGIIRTGR